MFPSVCFRILAFSYKNNDVTAQLQYFMRHLSISYCAWLNRKLREWCTQWAASPVYGGSPTPSLTVICVVWPPLLHVRHSQERVSYSSLHYHNPKSAPTKLLVLGLQRTLEVSKMAELSVSDLPYLSLKSNKRKKMTSKKMMKTFPKAVAMGIGE